MLLRASLDTITETEQSALQERGGSQVNSWDKGMPKETQPPGFSFLGLPSLFLRRYLPDLQIRCWMDLPMPNKMRGKSIALRLLSTLFCGCVVPGPHQDLLKCSALWHFHYEEWGLRDVM